MKITKATLKKFMRENEGKLLINSLTRWDPDSDGTRDSNLRGFTRVNKVDDSLGYTLGIQGAWFVGNSRDYFEAYEDEMYKGIKVVNCCGSFILGVNKSN